MDRLMRLVASPDFQSRAASLPVLRWFARRDGQEIFDILQGFVTAQVLSALVEMNILRPLLDGPAEPRVLAARHGIAAERMEILLQAGAALNLLKRRRDGRFALSRKGAAILGVPGLEAMISHHRAFYADMADPVTLLRGEGETELARFWPYVFGGEGVGRGEAERYSDLMAQSQALVAKDALRQVSLDGVTHLIDVGGGTGAFLAEALKVAPALRATLLDLPEVAAAAERRLGRLGLSGRVTFRPGNFREDALPEGADAISLVRVLYDHDDATVRALLSKAFAALPPGGRLIVAEPMSGGDRPDRATDVYFAFYTLAMQTGRTRSAARIAEMCGDAGFADIRTPRSRRPYVTSVLTCRKPAQA